MRESVELIRAAGATPVGVVIALDRMEKSGAEGAMSQLSAVQEVEQSYGMPVIPIANLNDLFAYLSGPGASAELARCASPLNTRPATVRRSCRCSARRQSSRGRWAHRLSVSWPCWCVAPRWACRCWTAAGSRSTGQLQALSIATPRSVHVPPQAAATLAALS